MKLRLTKMIIRIFHPLLAPSILFLRRDPGYHKRRTVHSVTSLLFFFLSRFHSRLAKLFVFLVMQLLASSWAVDHHTTSRTLFQVLTSFPAPLTSLRNGYVLVRVVSRPLTLIVVWWSAIVAHPLSLLSFRSLFVVREECVCIFEGVLSIRSLVSSCSSYTSLVALPLFFFSKILIFLWNI